MIVGTSEIIYEQKCYKGKLSAFFDKSEIVMKTVFTKEYKMAQKCHLPPFAFHQSISCCGDRKSYIHTHL